LSFRYFFEIGKLHLFLCAAIYFVLSAGMTCFLSKKDIRAIMKKSTEEQPISAGIGIEDGKSA